MTAFYGCHRSQAVIIFCGRAHICYLPASGFESIRYLGACPLLKCESRTWFWSRRNLQRYVSTSRNHNHSKNYSSQNPKANFIWLQRISSRFDLLVLVR